MTDQMEIVDDVYRNDFATCGDCGETFLANSMFDLYVGKNTSIGPDTPWLWGKCASCKGEGNVEA